MKKFFFALSWLLLTAGIISTSIASYYFYLLPKNTLKKTAAANDTDPADSMRITTILNEQTNNQANGAITIVETNDARAELVTRFLERYSSPLEPYSHYGKLFVKLADQYDFDFRLLPAIAMQESNLCKNIPPNSFNCLGFGIHERGTLEFENFEANFQRAARELKMYYIDEGLTTPQEIMTKYTPGSNGSWADSVNQWMTEMRYNDRELGKQLDQDNNVLEFTKEK